MAVATPAMFPVPTEAERAVMKDWYGVRAPSPEAASPRGRNERKASFRWRSWTKR